MVTSNLVQTFKEKPDRWIWLGLCVLLVITFIPWLGETLFNTKGEPREALVAVSMLDSGNWVLPTCCGGDIPYKPPMLAWLIAAFSWLLTGQVTEFTSRLPSALSVIALGLATFGFFKRHTTRVTAFLTAVVTVTAFEVFRAGTACRVDMLLTAFTVGSIYLMAKGKPCFNFWAVLTMTGAVLTKGPVGMVLPCFAVWVYFLIKRENWWQATWTIGLMGICSLILPAWWYVAAAEQGGSEFVRLAMEENVGRLTGGMSYESHVNPWYYNLITIVAGMAPWTLLVALGACGRWRKPDWKLSSLKLISLVVIAVFLVFYTIPASKRSVYLLPIYPFVAYYAVILIQWLWEHRRWSVKTFAYIMAGLAVLLPVALAVVKLGLIKVSGESLQQYISGVETWQFGIITWLLLVIAFVTGLYSFRMVSFRSLGVSVACIFAIYWNLSATAFPAVLNTKSDITLAQEIQKIAPTGKVKTYNSDRLLRYYTAGYYLHDRLEPYRGEKLQNGTILVVGEKDAEQFGHLYGQNFTADTIVKMPVKSCDTRQKTLILRLMNKN